MRRIYEGRVFAVEVGAHCFPNGSQHDVEVVRHRPSVVVVPLVDASRVLLIRQYRPVLGRYLWELPAGSTDPNEPADTAAVRECAEETGFVPSRVERLAALFPAPGFCDEELIFFKADGLARLPSDSPFRPDPDEDIEVHPIGLSEARAMVSRGDIVDLKTAYGLVLV